MKHTPARIRKIQVGVCWKSNVVFSLKTMKRTKEIERVKKSKSAENTVFSALFGTPERTLTSALSLRRRSLYTTELLGHIYEMQTANQPGYRRISWNIVTENKFFVNRTILQLLGHQGHILCTRRRKEETLWLRAMTPMQIWMIWFSTRTTAAPAKDNTNHAS